MYSVSRLVVEATEAARSALPELAVRWVRLERTGEPAGQLPSPGRAIPERDVSELKDDAVARAYRDLFWAMDVDPTKQRPAGEALARRVASEGKLPSILPIVDAYNLASAEKLVPLSSFDTERLDGSLTLDVAGEDETFEPIGADQQALEPGRPVWRDASGVVGLPMHRDGKRTALSEETEGAIVVAAGPKALGPRILPEALRTLETYTSIVGWRFAAQPGTLKL